MTMPIKVTITVPKTMAIQFLRVSAGVRYWEDATINGQPDADGTMTPLRNGALWEPRINLETGEVLDWPWPQGPTADIHFKVCDAGDYWLQDENGIDVAKWKGDYVPDGILCVGGGGYGDYIILKIGANGLIEGWHAPEINAQDWTAL